MIKTLVKQRAPVTGQTVVDARWQGYNADSVPAVAQLLGLQQVVQRELPQVTAPLLIFQGLQDQTLQLAGAQEVYDRTGATDKELVWLEHSSHCVALDVEWEMAAEATARFIRRLI